jgi:hypothetical protein
MFKKGDIVRLKITDPHPILGHSFVKQWQGLTCRVEEDQFSPQHKPLLIPLTRRPDGEGYHEFYWDAAEIELMEMPNVDEGYEID